MHLKAAVKIIIFVNSIVQKRNFLISNSLGTFYRVTLKPLFGARLKCHLEQPPCFSSRKLALAGTPI